MAVVSKLFATLTCCALLACGKSEAPPPSSSALTSSPSTPAPSSTAKDPEAAKKLIAAGAVVLDVRNPDEFATGHVPNAVNIPVGEVSGRLDEVARLVGDDKTKPIVVYCAAGRRAAKAKETLAAAGYSQVVNGGGYDDLH